MLNLSYLFVCVMQLELCVGTVSLLSPCFQGFLSIEKLAAGGCFALYAIGNMCISVFQTNSKFSVMNFKLFVYLRVMILFVSWQFCRVHN